MIAPNPKRRGRPRIHANDSAKKAAYRDRKRQREEAKKPVRRVLLTGSAAIRIQLHEAVKGKASKQILTDLAEKLIRAEQMEAFDRETAREIARDSKVNPLSLSRGLFLTDAPQGMGLLIVGLPTVEIADAQQVRDMVGGRRVRPKGTSPRFQEDVEARSLPVETHAQHFEKQWRDHSNLRCYRLKCKHLVVGILPQDHDKPQWKWRFHCYLHSPLFSLSEFRGREHCKTPKGEQD